MEDKNTKKVIDCSLFFSTFVAKNKEIKVF